LSEHGTKFDFYPLESLQCSPDPLAGLKGPTSKGKEGKKGEGRKEWKGGEVKRGDG